MKVLIVGANSILSKQLILQHSGDEVDVLYNSEPSDLAARNFQLSDLGKLTPDYNIVYIVSAMISNNADEINSLYEVNVKLVKTICDRFINSKIIYFSSVSVYDAIETGIIDSNTLPSPQSSYGISKLWGEKVVEQHPQYAIIRISSMYGKGMKETTFLPKIIESALTENQITILGEGTRKQNYIHVKDVASLAKKAATQNENLILLAISPTNYSNAEVAQLIKEITNCRIHYKGEDPSRSLEYKQSGNPLYQHTFTTLKQGIKELLEWKSKQY